MKVLDSAAVALWTNAKVVAYLNALWRDSHRHNWHRLDDWPVNHWANRLILEGELQRRGEQLPLF